MSDVKEVNLMVRVSVKPECTEDILPHMRTLQSATQLEPGCDGYQFYRDRKQPEVFYVQERYADRDSFHLHANSEHMLAYLNATKSMIESVDLHKVNPL